ncbi:methyl-accepting chemotaxis protein [Ideonella sp.]|uniref:methyl-accepting chemotaxis protein n=1 Tax=Ideonella sp. TaxID=1929293 RepID=UPI0035B456AF
MFQNLSFKRKIGTLVGVAVVGMAVVTAVSFFQLRDRIVQGRTDRLVTAVTSAHSIVLAYQEKAAAGAMPVEEAQKAAKDALRVARYGEGRQDYLYIWTAEGGGLMHPIKPEWDGQPMIGKVKDLDGMDIVQALVTAVGKQPDGAFVPTQFPRPGQKEPVPKLQYVQSVKGWGWIVGSGVYMDDVDAEVRAALWRTLAITVAVLGTIGTLGVVVARSVLGQIGGDPADALQVMNRVAKGDLSVNLGTHARGSLLAGLDEMIASLRGTVAQVRRSTDSIATASSQIAEGNHDLSARTEQTASNLQQTAASMEELTGTVNQTSASARQANELAASASEAAERGGRVVTEVVATMEEINQSSRRIEDIIGVIDGIAFQTNILALNAAVEAARAGEQGRGFAVVAGEVRNLAQRSANAAKEIKTLIAASVERVQSGTQLVGSAGTAMADIVQRVRHVSGIINEITHAAAEQSQGIGQVNAAVTNLDQMTQQNAALVEESAAAAESLREQAQRLADVVQVFRIEG